MAFSDDEGDEFGDMMFTEPSDYHAPPPPSTTVSYVLRDSSTLNLRLVGHNPLWGHHLWNGARCLAEYLQEPSARSVLQDARVLELGAGAGLPGLVAALNGAETVVLTDYPDPELVENLEYNVRHAASTDLTPRIQVAGYRWGARDLPLALQIPSFRLILLADVNFNHSEHRVLAEAVVALLDNEDVQAKAIIFFTPYRPWLLEKDRDLFRVLVTLGLSVRKIREQLMDNVMFEDDPGDEVLRRTVFGYEVRWPADGESPELDDTLHM